MALRETDIRTGLCTPGFLVAFGSRELAFAWEEGYPVSLVSIAIAGLREHVLEEEGDGFLALRDIGDCIKREAGEGSIVARVGLGEVAVLLPGLGSEKARRIAESIREAIIDNPRPPKPRLGAVSVGVASTSDEPTDFVELLRASQAALELSKSTTDGLIGNNRE